MQLCTQAAPDGTVPTEKCPAARCLPQHLSSALGEHQELLQPCSFPNSSQVLGGQSTAQAPCCNQTRSLQACVLLCVTSADASLFWMNSILFLLTVPPCRNLPWKALTRHITCIRLFLPQGFHKLQYSPASIFHPWRKDVKRVNHRDPQTISEAQHWREVPRRAPAPQQKRLAGCWHLAKYQRSHVCLVGGAASSPACKHVWNQVLP